MGSDGGGHFRYCGPCAICPEVEAGRGLAYLDGALVDEETQQPITGGPTHLTINGGSVQTFQGPSFLRLLPVGPTQLHLEAAGYQPLDESFSLEPCRLERTFALRRVPVSHEGPAVSCDWHEIRCRQPGGKCPPEMAASIDGDCYGACVWIGRCVCRSDDNCPPNSVCGPEGRCRELSAP